MERRPCSRGFEPDAALLARSQATGVSTIEVRHDPVEAVKGADVIYGDVWASMNAGQKEEAGIRV